MGIRAVIKFGETFIATHWDGDPESLGQDLIDLKTKDLDSIIVVAEKHIIDSATDDVLAVENPNRFRKICDKANGSNIRNKISKQYTAEELASMFTKEGKCLTFSLMSAEDQPLGKFEEYGDFAEYIYEILPNGGIRYAILDGEWIGPFKEEFKWQQLMNSNVRKLDLEE